MEKLIITAAVNGAEVMRNHTPYVPYTPEEVANAAVESADAGASIIHVHARCADGTATQDKEVYREIIERIREKSRVIVQVSTGGAVGMSAAERADVITLEPEMATLTSGTVNFGDSVFYNAPADIEQFAKLMAKHKVRPEVEVFDTGMITTAARLMQKGWLAGPLHFDLVMGVPGGISAEMTNLLHMVSLLPAGSTWTVAGIGRAQLPMATAAILLGGHARVGLEDNIYYAKGQLAKSNAELVSRVVRLAGELGREVATPDEARRLVGVRNNL